MGFNPFRESDKDLTEIIMMVAGIVVALGLVAWAIFSG